MARFEVPEGWTVQAFRFALDWTPEQAACVRRQFGGRRYARNWAVRVLKGDLARYHATREASAKPSLSGLRKQWNRVKGAECVDAATGEAWWPEISKEAFADGIRAAVDAYWNWQASRAGRRAGPRVGFPRFAKKGRDRDRVTFTTGAIHVLTTRLAKTHGEIVVEDLNAAGVLRQKGLTGARARRRGLSDSALGEARRQLGYKAGWYGARLVVADRWFPSSKTCHACQRVQEIGWAEHWTCESCGARHQRDDNAAINLARSKATIPVLDPAGDTAVGPVGAAVKRGADRKTGPRPAVGCEARKGRGHRAVEQPREGVLAT